VGRIGITAAEFPRMRTIWTGAGRTLPSNDLLNSGSSSSADLVAPAQLRKLRARTARPFSAPGLLSSRLDALTGPSLPRGRRRGVLAVLLSVALVATAVLSTSSASAAPKPRLKEVERRIEKLNNQAEQATEDFLNTRESLKSINVRLRAAQTKLNRQRIELKKSQAKLGKLAAESYRRGELSALGLVLGDDPEMQLAQAGYLPSLGVRQAGAMNRLKDGERKLAATESEIKKQKAKAETARATLVKTRATVRKRLAQASAQLNRLRPGDRRTVTTNTNSRGSAGLPPGGGGAAFCNGRAAYAATSAGRTAIEFACGQLGEPYVWAGAGPGIWDCSGLTMRAFEAAGVSLPHSSGQQANHGTRISNSNIQAGDLLFFNSPISHVGISLGDNLMVHAPHSGDVVRVVSLYDTPSVVVRL
jgi:peptidoglycan DL-endopeptidase CwlO